MGRFTTDPKRIQHLKDIGDALLDTASKNKWRVKVTLTDGTTITGHLAGLNGANAPSRTGGWGYSGTASITDDDDGSTHTIDRLDIVKVEAP